MNFDQIETQAFVQRMFSHYLETGMSSQAAFDTLSDKLGPQFQTAIKTLEISALVSNTASNTIKKTLFTESLHGDIRALGGNTEYTAENTHKVLREIAPGVKTCARFFSALFVYPLIILSLALCVYVVYKIFVLPQIVAISGVDNLPQLTLILFSDVSAMVVLVVIAVIAIFLILQIAGLLRAFAKIKPTRSVLGRLTGLSQYHSYLIFLAYLKVLLKSKTQASSSELAEKASRYSAVDKMGSRHCMLHRTAIGLVSEEHQTALLNEVEFQIDDLMSSLEQIFVAKQEKILLFFQISIFFFVGGMITAMYLPIFKLASVF